MDNIQVTVMAVATDFHRNFLILEHLSVRNTVQKTDRDELRLFNCTDII